MTDLLSFQGVRAPVRGGGTGGPWTFTVPAGSAVAAQGAPSVADAVVRICSGSLAPSEGRVRVLDTSPELLSRRGQRLLARRMGIVFLKEGLVSNLSLEENLILPLVFGGGRSTEEARSRARDALSDLGLEGYRGHRPGALPREVRISAALARAVLRDPELLVLEHLTSDLPGPMARRVLRWCRDRCSTVLVLVPGPSIVLDDLGFDWLPPLSGDGEEGTAT